VIQRPQTIFLVLTVILNLAVFFTPIYSHAVNDPATWFGMGMAISLTMPMIIAVVSIFLYKNRPTQLKWVKIATYVEIVALGFALGVLFSLGGFGKFLWKEVVSSGIIILTLASLWQAGRLIKKDEELVKSMNRIR
jgi:heme exporter protein D